MAEESESAEQKTSEQMTDDPAAAVEEFGSFGDVILDRIFGQGWDELEAGEPGSGEESGALEPTLIFDVLQNANEVALAVVSTAFIYILTIATIGSAHEGKALGSRYDSIWTPVRSVMSVSMLAPVANGLSLLQVIILGMVATSSHITNTMIWNPALEYLVDSGGQVIVGQSNKIPENAARIADTSLNAALYQDFLIEEMEADFPSNLLTIEFVPHDEGSSGSGDTEGEGSSSGGGGGSGDLVFTFVPPETVPMQKIRAFSDSDRTGESELPVEDVDFTKIVDQEYQREGRGISGTETTYSIFGKIEIPCTSQRSALCQSRKEAATALMGTMRSVAKDVVDPEEAPDTGAVMEAVDTYKETITSSFKEDIRNGDDGLNKDLEEFRSTAKTVGWISAGMWYWTITGYQERASNIATSTVSVQSPDLQKLSPVVNDQLADSIGAAEAAERALFNKLKSAAGSYADGSGGNLGLDTFMGWIVGDAFFVDSGMWVVDKMTSGDPLRFVSSVGHDLMVAAETIGTTVFVARMAAAGFKGAKQKSVWGWAADFFSGGITAGIVHAVAEATKMLLTLGMVLMFLLYIPALFFAYYLPAIPFFMWFSAVIGWLIMIVVAMVAAPLWAAAHVVPDNEPGVSGQMAQQGYRVFLSLLLRPPLMLIGLLFAIGLIAGIMKVLGLAYGVFFSAVEAGAYTSILTPAIMLLMFGGIVVVYTHRIFGLITDVPERAMEFIGAKGLSMGEDQDKSHMGGIAMAGFREGTGQKDALGGMAMADDDDDDSSGGGGNKGGGKKGGGPGGGQPSTPNTKTSESDLAEGQAAGANAAEKGGDAQEADQEDESAGKGDDGSDIEFDDSGSSGSEGDGDSPQKGNSE